VWRLHRFQGSVIELHIVLRWTVPAPVEGHAALRDQVEVRAVAVPHVDGPVQRIVEASIVGAFKVEAVHLHSSAFVETKNALNKTRKLLVNMPHGGQTAPQTCGKVSNTDGQNDDHLKI
jgi:hypothetical protein